MPRTFDENMDHVHLTNQAINRCNRLFRCDQCTGEIVTWYDRFGLEVPDHTTAETAVVKLSTGAFLSIRLSDFPSPHGTMH